MVLQYAEVARRNAQQIRTLSVSASIYEMLYRDSAVSPELKSISLLWMHVKRALIKNMLSHRELDALTNLLPKLEKLRENQSYNIEIDFLEGCIYLMYGLGKPRNIAIEPLSKAIECFWFVKREIIDKKSCPSPTDYLIAQVCDFKRLAELILVISEDTNFDDPYILESWNYLKGVEYNSPFLNSTLQFISTIARWNSSDQSSGIRNVGIKQLVRDLKYHGSLQKYVRELGNNTPSPECHDNRKQKEYIIKILRRFHSLQHYSPNSYFTEYFSKSILSGIAETSDAILDVLPNISTRYEHCIFEPYNRQLRLRISNTNIPMKIRVHVLAGDRNNCRLISDIPLMYNERADVFLSEENLRNDELMQLSFSIYLVDSPSVQLNFHPNTDWIEKADEYLFS
ncbi:MAG: hypothetical protein ACFFEV_02805 [Candidatus Thorarchaeota archaeon]